jgi:predicted ArsR family transcriptional regulator
VRARLFPQSYDRFANEVLDFLTAEHGRDGLLAFLRWRVDREVDALADAVQDGPLEERVARFAEALTSAGFVADVVHGEDHGPDATTLPTLQLVQHHCVIEEVAREHPEICAYEAAAFSRALGTDVQLSRRTTIADGAQACVCTVTAGLHRLTDADRVRTTRIRPPAPDHRRTPTTTTTSARRARHHERSTA